MTAGLPRSDSSGASLFIINLTASAAPMALEAPDAPELSGYAVFRSRRIEDGRDRYRLHLGYFDSQELAESVLPLLRSKYPAAWVALAPRENMGSLDDTNVAQFKFIPKKAPKVKPAAQPKLLAVAPPPAPQAAPHPEPPVLQPAQVLTLLESAPRTMPASAALPAPPPVAINANQRFAVQLIWTAERVDTASIPQLAIFDAYTLYTVQVQRAGRRWYGLRLGFFSDPISARQVSLYARSDFSAASVVPVSERECDRAAEAALASLKKTAEKIAPAAPAKPSASLTVTPAKKPTPAPKPKVELKLAGKTSKKSRSTEELLEELGANEMTLQSSGDDPLNDTGVRHLSVAVVKRKASGKR